MLATTRPDKNPHALWHAAFYKFVHLDSPRYVADLLRQLETEVLGNILVAREGLNGAVAGTAAAIADFEDALTGDARFGGRFDDLVFKHSACITPPFQRLKVHVRAEVLPLGFVGASAGARPGMQLSPMAWRQVLDEGKAVVIDNRNHFEFRLGRFRGAIDPGAGNFRDLPQYILAHAEAWKAQGARIAMYCTGGIRCEKTAAWMNELGLPVWQLEGGILNYFAQMPDAEQHWEGECFVFDNRVALDTKLRETGTTADDVYRSDAPDEGWRLQRARRLAAARGTS